MLECKFNFEFWNVNFDVMDIWFKPDNDILHDCGLIEWRCMLCRMNQVIIWLLSTWINKRNYFWISFWKLNTFIFGQRIFYFDDKGERRKFYDKITPVAYIENLITDVKAFHCWYENHLNDHNIVFTKKNTKLCF